MIFEEEEEAEGGGRERGEDGWRGKRMNFHKRNP